LIDKTWSYVLTLFPCCLFSLTPLQELCVQVYSESQQKFLFAFSLNEGLFLTGTHKSYFTPNILFVFSVVISDCSQVNLWCWGEFQ